jgi:hypothetical protein
MPSRGEPLLENVREAWNDWRKANEVAACYDRKIAGAYLLLHYPSFGQGIDQNGAKLDKPDFTNRPRRKSVPTPYPPAPP